MMMKLKQSGLMIIHLIIVNCTIFFLVENDVAPIDPDMCTLEYAKSWDSYINDNHIYIEPWKAEVAHMLNSWKAYFE